MKYLSLALLTIFLTSCSINFTKNNSLENKGERKLIQEIQKNYSKKTLNQGSTHDRANKIIKRLCFYNKLKSCPELVIFNSNDISSPFSGVETISFTAGTIDAIKDDSELAFVLGHEIAHILLNHTQLHETDFRKKFKAFAERAKLVDATLELPFGLGGNLAAYPTPFGLLFVVRDNQTSLDKFSHNMEYQSDKMSISLLCDSGYYTRASLNFWRQTVDIFDVNKTLYKSTHPSSKKRLARLRTHINSLTKKCRGTF